MACLKIHPKSTRNWSRTRRKLRRRPSVRISRWVITNTMQVHEKSKKIWIPGLTNPLQGIMWIFNPFGQKDARVRVIQQAAWLGVVVKVQSIRYLLTRNGCLSHLRPLRESTNWRHYNFAYSGRLRVHWRARPSCVLHILPLRYGPFHDEGSESRWVEILPLTFQTLGY